MRGYDPHNHHHSFDLTLSDKIHIKVDANIHSNIFDGA